MIRPLIISVPHSGTRFMKEEIFNNQAMMRHFVSFDWNPTYPRPIVPLRHPLDLAFSWKRRGNKLAGLFEAWDSLVAQAPQLNPIYFRMWPPWPDWLALRKEFNLTHTPDWEHKVTDRPRHFIKPATLTLPELHKIKNDIVIKHYDFLSSVGIT